MIRARADHHLPLFRSHARAATAALASVARPRPPSDAPWHATPVSVTVCDDTCASSRDGVCDDGRAAAGAVKCDVGRDCADCGPWTAALPPALAAALPRPIADLAADGVTDVRVTRTATDPSFLRVFTDPAADVDVSGQLAADRVVERGLTQLWHARLADACGGGDGGGGGGGAAARLPSLSASRAPPPPPPLVLDVGANFGYYSLYAAALGCRAIAWEPVPRFRSFLTAGLLLNPGAPLAVDPRPAAACAPGAPPNVTLAVPARGVWGTASVDGANIDAAVDNGGPLATATAACETVDAVVAARTRAEAGGRARVALLKADVEGYEPDVLAGAAALLSPVGAAARAARPASLPDPPDNVVLEDSPGVYEARGRWAEAGAWPGILVGLRAAGYALFAVPDSRADLAGGDWGRPLPPLPTITDAVLAHDVADAARAAARTLGCHAPDRLKRVAPRAPWGACGAIPESLHPRSFRATFGHNTNVWAGRGGLAGLTEGGEEVGVFGPADPARGAWFSDTRTEVGLGGRPCAGLPPEVQVVHRCRCRQPAVCGKEEAAAVQAAQEGLLPPEAYEREG